MEISYDPEKRAWTLAERGLDFNDATHVFAGRTIDLLDDRKDYGEVRWVTYGRLKGRMIVLVWTLRGKARHIICERPMTENKKPIATNWDPDDDAPELTPELATRAQISIGGKVVRKATGTLTKRGRPPIGSQPKKQVTLRLPVEVLEYFKSDGPGWQTRVSEVLERYTAKDKRKQAEIH